MSKRDDRDARVRDDRIRVRVVRVIEYEGSRRWIARTLRRSIRGDVSIGPVGRIRSDVERIEVVDGAA